MVSLNSYYGHSEPLVTGQLPTITMGSHVGSSYSRFAGVRYTIYTYI